MPAAALDAPLAAEAGLQPALEGDVTYQTANKAMSAKRANLAGP